MPQVTSASREHIDPNDVRFFSGRSNPALAEKIADYLDLPLADTHFSKFSNDNLFVQLGSSVRGRRVFLVQSLVPPVSDNLLELLMMLDIAKSAAAHSVHAIIPYFSYARSDKKDAPRISIAARLVADLMQTAGATRVMTMQLHSPQVHGFFSVPTDPLTARGLFAEYVEEHNLATDETIVVAPDVGGAKSAGRFAELLDLPLAAAQKTRISDKEVRIGGFFTRVVEGFKHVIIYDDEIATGGTVAELSHVLVQHGIEWITVICTHGLFLGPAVSRLNNIPQIKEVITSDTVIRPPERRPRNLTVLSTASVFGQAIWQNYMHRSIGELFDFGHNKDE